MSGLGSTPGEQGSSGATWARVPRARAVGANRPAGPGLSTLADLPERGEDAHARAEGRGGHAREALVRTPVWRDGVGKIFQGNARFGVGQAGPARWCALVIQLFKLTNIMVIYALQWQ